MRLERNQAYPGSSLVILTTGHAERLSQLDEGTARAFYEDMLAASRAIETVFSPAHINCVLLGNVVPHLHWIIVPRYRTDARWGRPIWTTDRSEMPVEELEPHHYADICERLREALAFRDRTRTGQHPLD
jgi:diadenosine tetraphosphate (Ap4A) HIT family hydrolase